MKIITIVNNYGKTDGGACNQQEDISVENPQQKLDDTDLPGWYVMPDSCILRTGNPVFLPSPPVRWHARLSAAVKISRLGKSISAKFAPRYYSEMTLAVVLSDDALAARLAAAGLPTAPAYIFDRACILGDFADLESLDINDTFTLTDGENAITWKVDELRRTIDQNISLISKDNILKIGDIFIAGVTDNYLTLNSDTHLRAYSSGTDKWDVIDINVK